MLIKILFILSLWRCQGVDDFREKLGNSSLHGISFTGKWDNEFNQFSYFDKSAGFINNKFEFVYDEKLDKYFLDMNLSLYDGDYFDRNNLNIKLKFEIDKAKNNYKNFSSVNDKFVMDFYSGNKSIIGNEETRIEFKLFKKDGKDINIFNTDRDKLDLEIELKLNGSNVNVNMKKNSIEFIAWTVFIFIQLIFSLLSILTLYNAIKHSQFDLILTISNNAFIFNLGWDVLYLCFLFYYSINIIIIYFEYFFFLNLFFVFSFLIKLRTVLFLFRQRLINNNVDLNNNRCNKFVWYTFKVFILIFIFTFLPKFIIAYPFILLIILAYPAFQIYYNINNNTRTNCFRFKIHLPLFISSYFLPNYLKGYGGNIFKISTFQYFTIINLSILSLIILILVWQKLFGPKFFIPKKYIKDYHQYFINYKKLKKLKIEEKECSICMSFLNEKDNNDLSEKLIKKNKKKQNLKIMITPCKHVFHIDCLKTWMDQQMKCPNCRKKLPTF